MHFSLYLIVAFVGLTLLSFLVILLVRGLLKRLDNKVSAHLNARDDLNALLNSLNDVIFEFNEERVCLNVWFNERDDRVVDPRVCIGKKLEEVIGYEKALKFNQALDFAIDYKQPTSLEYVSDFGTGAWLLAKVTPVFDNKGKYLNRVSASVSNISEQKRYESKLKEKELLLLEAQHVAKIGNWLYDKASQEIFLSESLFRIMGSEGLALKGRAAFEYYISLVHHDDREKCQSFLSAVSSSATKQLEHKLITPEGELKYIRIIVGDKTLNNDGTIQRVAGIIQDITEIKLSEKLIKRGKAELIEAQTIAKIGNWSWRPSTKKLSYSDELVNIFEVNTTKFISISPFRFLLKVVHENDRQIVRNLYKSGINASDHSCVFRILTSQKKVKYISIIIGKILRNEKGQLNKIIGTIQDITEQKQFELDYTRTDDKFKRILEAVNLVAVTVDRTGTIVFCNQHLANLLGYTRDEIIGMNWYNSFIPDGIVQHINGMIDADALPSKYTNAIKCKDGSECIISWKNTMTRDENGEIDEITGIGEDVTEQFRVTQELISAKEMAEKSSKFKSEFLSTMSHEIRTPMNAVIGTTNLLLNENPRPEQMEYLNILKFSGENLLAIINDILDYNKIEAGKLELNPQNFDLRQLAQKTIHIFSARAAEKNLQLELLADDGIPDNLMGDQQRLSQILNNLISNAIKFTDSGKITLQLQLIIKGDAGVTVKFVVADTGIGISPEHQSVIFDPFVQDPVINQPVHMGTGLGLAITKRLVNLHKSDISVVSDTGKGAQFTFVITFALAHTEITEEKKNVGVQDVGALNGMQVLVVDDNKMNLLIASKFLKKWHINVDSANNGEEAVSIAAQKRYDLIIMDLQMPFMNGFEATEKIREFDIEVPIIALTADAMPDTYDKAISSGMNDYLTKPFVPDVLFNKISTYYKKRDY
ncbi:PAS domain-containing hybrid sensor histidine kinase/response regulator [Mucilaginibacter auburnensis]|uniref:Sensory/regulatory protein RpfC n=1 Tax=Mucilaginibacter auburnensis TaxID=1457233 RepID=A0A2H9VVE7_9SPHI|nr:PAS domain S-box protein [Mucilaginibacter auburnensis]PJJ84791.1 PAS domain S-box-containing protein [Mucilaginibacter auburnensis]